MKPHQLVIPKNKIKMVEHRFQIHKLEIYAQVHYYKLLIIMKKEEKLSNLLSHMALDKPEIYPPKLFLLQVARA